MRSVTRFLRRACLVPAFACAVFGAALPPAPYAAEAGTPYRQLRWSDFRGPAPSGRGVAALTVSGVDLRWRTALPVNDGDTWRARLEVTCRALMYREASGVKPGKATGALLGHEQRHFDITEYWAREMRRTLGSVEGTGATPQRAADRATARARAKAAELNRKLERMQEKYDRDTDHGRDVKKQAEWAARIAEWLSETATGDAPRASRED